MQRKPYRVFGLKKNIVPLKHKCTNFTLEKESAAGLKKQRVHSILNLIMSLIILNGFGPVCSVYFTEDQLVEFIISAEKALRSIRS
jgi:hypothetical protein